MPTDNVTGKGIVWTQMQPGRCFVRACTNSIHTSMTRTRGHGLWISWRSWRAGCAWADFRQNWSRRPMAHLKPTKAPVQKLTPAGAKARHRNGRPHVATAPAARLDCLDGAVPLCGNTNLASATQERGSVMEHARLMVHAGGVRVSREQLAGFETPSATATWKPLPHHVLVDAIHAEVNNRNIAVVTEEYAIQRKNNMLVGTMVLNWLQNDEFAAALAFRHANDMSEAVKLYAGVRVFACDNTAVSGDEIILRKKHTKHFDIHAELPEAFDRYKEGTLVLQRGIEELKGTLCSELDAKEMIYDIFRKK